MDKIKIVYFSKTKNVEKFCTKIKYKSIKGESNLVMNSPYILIAYTSGFGEIPTEIGDFLKNEENIKNLHGVVGSGNKNWGHLYCNASNLISQKYNVEVLMNFELSGNIHDVSKFEEMYKELNE